MQLSLSEHGADRRGAHVRGCLLQLVTEPEPDAAASGSGSTDFLAAVVRPRPMVTQNDGRYVSARGIRLPCFANVHLGRRRGEWRRRG